eukprot:276985_1
MSLPIMSCLTMLLFALINSAYSQQCSLSSMNSTFPINLDGYSFHGVEKTNSTNLNDCYQECCNQIGCEVFSFDNTNKACYTGNNAYSIYTPGFISRARHAPATSHIWPLPQKYTFSSYPNYYIDSSSFQFNTNSNSTIIKNAITRYQSLTFPLIPENPIPTTNNIKSITITIENDDENLSSNMNETYTLQIPSKTDPNIAIITANSIWGGLRALETLSQLVQFNYTQRYYNIFGCNIIDYPRFPHRGILIDSSRFYLTISSIKQLLDAMSYSKLNVLHMHITDDESFPVESKTYPKLWQNPGGSYSYSEKYLQTSLTQIIEYGKARGIRIIPEFDMPGHAKSWCYGYPEICPSQTCLSPLNVASNKTWQLLNGFINEMSTLFTDDFIHLGGDEVNTNCWTSNTEIINWMKINNLTVTQALQYFDGNVINIGAKNDKTVIQWDEVFTLFMNNKNDNRFILNPNISVVHVWHETSGLLKQVVENGFRGIYSPDPNWYLDHRNVNWETEYLIEPLDGINDLKQQMLVIGGEACMWGVQLDSSNIQQTIWPRAAAIGERLWSNRNVNDTQFAYPRITYFRCLLNERNIAAAPAYNGNAAGPPGAYGSCYQIYN